MRTPNALDVYGRVQGTILSGAEVGSTLAGGLAAETDEQACNELNAIDKTVNPEPRLRDCRQAEDWFLGMLNRPAKHTVASPEEIFPEIFDPIILPAYKQTQERSAAGLVRLTP
jgi:hypothetical protein